MNTTKQQLPMSLQAPAALLLLLLTAALGDDHRRAWAVLRAAEAAHIGGREAFYEQVRDIHARQRVARELAALAREEVA